jgi:5-(carboxyamino)imidazole ribonucleotide mutase
MPTVAVLMGSDSDLETLKSGLSALDGFGIPFEVRVISAHRAPRVLADYVATAPGRGVKIFIAAAGGAAHLPGVVAALTPLPVIGVPIPTQTAHSLDSILSILSMPSGVPVATMAAGSAGAANAAILAAQILALSDEALAKRVREHKVKLERAVMEKDARVQEQFRGTRP